MLGRPGRPRDPIGVLVMLVALVVAAFVGATAGLIWQSADGFGDEPPADEVLTTETASS